MKYLEEFFTSLHWWELSPDNDLLAEQPAGEDPIRHVSASRSEKGDLELLYLPVGGEVKLKAGSMTSGLKATWFDPRNGKRMATQPVSENRFRAPDQNDWVLLLQK